MATEKKIIKVESEKKETTKKKGIDLNDVKDFVIENKDTIIKVVEVAGTVIAAKKAKDAVTKKKSSSKKTTTKKTTAKKTTTKKSSNDDPLSTITDLAGKFLG